MFRILVRPQFYIESLTNYNGSYVICKKIDQDNLLLKYTNTNDDLYDEITISSNIEYNTKYQIVKEQQNKFSKMFDDDFLEAGRIHSRCIYPHDTVVIAPNSLVRPHSIQLYRSEAEDVCIIYFGIPTFFEECEPEEFNYPGKFGEYLWESYSEYQLKKLVMKRKKELLSDLDPNNSLAYMEAQLDFVTKILLTIIEKEPYLKGHVLEAVREYSNFKAVFDETTLFAVKDEHQCYLEIARGKKLIRQKQGAFLSEKAGILAGDINGN